MQQYDSRYFFHFRFAGNKSCPPISMTNPRISSSPSFSSQSTVAHLDCAHQVPHHVAVPPRIRVNRPQRRRQHLLAPFGQFLRRGIPGNRLRRRRTTLRQINYPTEPRLNRAALCRVTHRGGDVSISRFWMLRAVLCIVGEPRAAVCERIHVRIARFQ